MVWGLTVSFLFGMHLLKLCKQNLYINLVKEDLMP